jgi:hypothetical protein
LLRASNIAPVLAMPPEEGGGVERSVEQDEHARLQQRQQASGQGGLVPLGGRTENSAEQTSGAGLDQGHQSQGGVAGPAKPVFDPAEPAAVAVGVGDLQRVTAVEGDGAQAAVAHARGAGLGQRAGYHLEQGFHRRRPRPAAQVTQGFFRRAWHRQARQSGGQLVPNPGVSQAREHAQREHEVHPDSRWQITQPALRGPGLLQDVIDQFKRQVLSQLTQMAGRKNTRGGRDGPRKGHGGRLQTQRSS